MEILRKNSVELERIPLPRAKQVMILKRMIALNVREKIEKDDDY